MSRADEALMCLAEHIESRSWDGFEACAEDCDEDGKPKCSLLHHECGTCRGCYADYGDPEPEPDAECTGGGDYSCLAVATLQAALAERDAAMAVVVAAEEADREIAYIFGEYEPVIGTLDANELERVGRTLHAALDHLKEVRGE